MIIDEGIAVIKVPYEKIQLIASKFELIFRSNNSSRNGYVLTEGIVYAIGSRAYGNKAWREHAAQSTRELLDDWQKKGAISAAFLRAFKDVNPNFPRITQVEYADFYNEMEIFYGYFSGVVHQDARGIIERVQDLGDKYARPGSDSDDQFVTNVTEFLQRLDKFLSDHAS